MARSILDQPKPRGAGRLRRYLRLEREETGVPHKASQALVRRERERSATRRLRHFLRIARGHTA